MIHVELLLLILKYRLSIEASSHYDVWISVGIVP